MVVHLATERFQKERAPQRVRDRCLGSIARILHAHGIAHGNPGSARQFFQPDIE